MHDKREQEDIPVLLCTLADDVITNMLIAALKDNGIPAMKKTKGIGQALSIVMGFSNENVEIYVPSDLLNEAREIFDIIMAEDESEESDESE